MAARIAPLTEQATLAIYRGQQEHAWSKAFVEHVERRRLTLAAMFNPTLLA